MTVEKSNDKANLLSGLRAPVRILCLPVSQSKSLWGLRIHFQNRHRHRNEITGCHFIEKYATHHCSLHTYTIGLRRIRGSYTSVYI